MQNTTADYKFEINKPSRSFECKITIGNNIYTNEDLVNLTLEYSQPQEGFAIGNTISQSLDLTLLNRGDIIYSTSQIKVQIGLKIDSTIEYILMGIFNIDDIEKTDYTSKFTAYDNMIKFETPYFSSLGDKPTLKQVVNELSQITGVEFIGSLPDYNVSKLEGFTCREVLSYVAIICGGNAVITRDGKFTIKSLSEVEKSIDGNNYFDYTREEVKYKVGQISCQVDENSILSKGSTGTDSMELGFENPWVTETILNDLYNKLNGLSYLGYSMKWQGDICLDPYDIITVTDIKNVVRKIPILSQKITYTGGLTSEIGAKGETKNKNSFSSSGSTTNKVNRAVIEQAIIKEALIEKANIKDVEAVSIRTQTLEAKTAKIEDAIIDVAHIKDLNAINANIQNLIAADATINNALINKADITELNAVKGTINVLESDTANIKNLLAGNITSESGQLIHLTASNVVIADAVIKDLIASNISVENLKTSDISTTKFRIVSDNGGIEIVGATQQFKDKNNKVRIQMGQDATGNFNFILRGEDGTTTLIDHTGIKEKAIADNLIKGNMVATDAIGEKQINYSSLITGLNKDTNTSLIKASKVAIDLTGQSLEVSFNSLKSNVDNMEIGGRNLVDNSSGNLGIDLWVNSGMTQFTFVVNGGVNNNSLKLVGATTDTGRKNISQSVLNKLINKDLKKITLSYWYKANDSSDKNGVGAFLRISNSSSPYNDTLSSINKCITDNKWRYITITEDLSKYNNTGITSIELFFFTFKGTVEYSNIKLELGDKATDWTPAPEDIEVEIESNTTAITVAQGKIDGLISESPIIKGDITTISDKYTSLKATVDGINTTVASHTSSITTIKDAADTANTKIDSLEIGGVNLLVQKSVTKSKYLNNTGATVDNGDWFYTDYITVKGFKNVRISGFTNLGASPSTCFYDANKTFIKGIHNNNSGNVSGVKNNCELMDVPSNAVYMRCSGEIANLSTLKIEQGTKATNYSPSPEDVSGKITTVENKYASLSQELSGFKTTVGNTYSTKTELSTVDGKVTSLNSRVSTAESSITQLNNQIKLKVEATDITTAINNVQIGGRNLVSNSAPKTTGWSWAGVAGTISLVDESTAPYGKAMKAVFTTISTGAGGMHKPPRIRLTVGKVYSWSVWLKANKAMTILAGQEQGGTKNCSVTTSWKKFTHTFTANDNANQSFIMYTQGSKEAGDYYIAHSIKVEEGNKPTDWTSAPEDINSDIMVVDTKITTTSNKVATIETNLNSITQRVSSTEQKVTTVTTTANTAKSTADSANSKIDSLKIGSRNLFKDTRDYGNATLGAWNQIYGSTTNTSEVYNGCKVVRVTSQWGRRSQTISCEPNTEYVISAWVKGGNTTTTIQSYCDNATRLSEAWSSSSVVGTSWKRYWAVWRTGASQTSLPIRIEPTNSSNCDLYICGLMVEKGNKASDWSPAPEDVDSSIASVQTQVTTTSNKVATIETNLNSITSRVSSTESTVTTINGNVTSLQSRMTTAEQKITPTAITTTISSVITGGTGSISTTQFVMDKNGLAIKNGALTIQNKSGTTVLNSDTNGNLIITGEMRSQYGQQWVGLNAGGLTFQDSQRNEQMLRVGLAYYEANRDMNGIEFAMPQYSDFIRFSHISKADLNNGWSSSDTSYNFFELWSGTNTFGGSTRNKGMTVNAPLYIKNSLKFYSGTNHFSEINRSVSWSNASGTISNMLGVYGDNGSVLGYKSGENLTARIIVTEEAHPGTGDNIISWGNYNFNGYTFHNANIVAKSLSVSGSKNCLQETKSYGERLINAYETAEYYFGDLGFGKINSDGECLVNIDDTFLECVNTNVEYHVFTQIYNGAIKTIERYKTYFIVTGDPGTEFGWELKAKRVEYENNRLDTPDIETQGENKIELFGDLDFKVETSEDTLMDILTFELEDLLLMEG